MESNYYKYKSQTRTYSSSKPIEITVLSAEDLRINKRSISRNAFVTVRSDPFDGRTTAVDAEGGSYPKWNEKISLDLGANAAALTIEVQCKTSFGGTRVVGTASVPVSDFSGGYVPESYLHFLSYRLWDSRGQRNGVINISVRSKVLDDTCPASTSGVERTTVGLAAGNQSDNKLFNNNNNNNNNISNGFGGAGDGVVTGVPVWCAAYQRNF